MFSETAKQDIRALRACGCRLTDDDVIALNDLALQIESANDMTCFSSPRIAFCGNIVLHEPTIGGLCWWLQYGKGSTNDPRRQMMVYFFMMAHCRNLDVLNALQTPKEIMQSVRRWENGIQATEGELWRGLLYVKRWYDGDGASGENEPIDDDSCVEAMWDRVLTYSSISGVKPEDLMCRTNSQLVKMLMVSSLHNHQPIKPSIADKYVKYRQLIKSIEDRANGD